MKIYLPSIAIIILAVYLSIDIYIETFFFYEVSHYLFLTVMSFLGLKYCYNEYVRMLFLYFLLESMSNTLLVLFDVYAPFLGILYCVFLVYMSLVTIKARGSFKRTFLEQDENIVYSLHKGGGKLNIIDFASSLLLGYPITGYYCNGYIYHKYGFKGKFRLEKKTLKTYMLSKEVPELTQGALQVNVK